MRYFLVSLFLAALVFAVHAEEKEGSTGGEEKKKDSPGTVIGIDLGTTYSW